MPYLFLGERPSNRALALGATWRSGGLSGAVLHRALRAAGLDPRRQRYANVFVCATGAISRWSLWRVRRLAAEGYQPVALGRKVRRVLDGARIRYIAMIHPAARGRIRNAELYDGHVRSVLAAEQPKETP